MGWKDDGWEGKVRGVCSWRWDECEGGRTAISRSASGWTMEGASAGRRDLPNQDRLGSRGRFVLPVPLPLPGLAPVVLATVGGGAKVMFAVGVERREWWRGERVCGCGERAWGVGASEAERWRCRRRVRRALRRESRMYRDGRAAMRGALIVRARVGRESVRSGACCCVVDGPVEVWHTGEAAAGARILIRPSSPVRASFSTANSNLVASPFLSVGCTSHHFSESESQNNSHPSLALARTSASACSSPLVARSSL